MATEDQVLKILKDSTDPLKSGEIAEQGGLDKKDVAAAIKKLKASGQVTSPIRCYYTAE
ncbi:MAG: transcriptional regulator [Bifidobacteriaceae bacterium]|jgi:DNA-binding MarR family transcriptional regulator|nr:transcriptional regulator [Bifidobacteriaceae bacterium]